MIVCSKSTDPHLIKCPAGRNEAFVIGWQRNIILFKKVLVHYKSMRIRTYRKPVDASILIHKIVEVCVIDSTCSIGCGKIHQAVLQRTCIMQRKPAAGYNIRQSIVFIQKPVEIQIIIAYYKLNIDIRELFLDVRCIFFIQARAPQIHRECVCIFLFRTLPTTA